MYYSFLQNCYYVPPSLRTRATVNRTPPSLGSRGYVDQKSARKSSGPGTVPFSKTTSLKPHVAFGAGVQRKLEMDGKDLNKNDKSIKSSVKQPKYRPPVRNSPCKLLLMLYMIPFLFLFLFHVKRAYNVRLYSLLSHLFTCQTSLLWKLKCKAILVCSLHLPREDHSWSKRSSGEVVENISGIWQANN